MIDKLERDKCTGCSACSNICPQNCITMIDDPVDGFLYPKIEEANCIRCNLCEKVCPSLNQYLDEEKHGPQVKAAWSKNKDVRWQSTSGGIFTELATFFLSDGGYVVGARYVEKFLVEHYIISDLTEIPVLRQSKYVQSNKKDIFKQIKRILNTKQKVLFVGAPCEVAGLYKFLQKKYSNLITIDFVCLGANSPKVYLKFLAMLEEIYNSKIEKVWFKNKEFGWNLFSTKVEFASGDCYLEDRNHDYFMRGYIGKNKFYIRPACTDCKYKKIPRVADITLADFWGIAKKNKNLDEDQGTSLVLINSDKGKQLFHNIKDGIYSHDCDLKDAIEGNGALFNSAKLDEKRDQFFHDLDFIRFDALIEKYCRKEKKGVMQILKSLGRKIYNIVKK